MAIQMRRGEKKDFKPEKLKVGEFAVPTDTGEVYIKTSENTTKGIATLKANGKLEQMPTYSDVGAAPSSHNHSASNITSGTLPVSRGGTGATQLTSGNILIGNGTEKVNTMAILPISKGGTNASTVSEALNSLNGVPKTRTINGKDLSDNVDLVPDDIGAVLNTRKVNSKPLSNDITLSYSDVGAAASSHGNHVPTTQTANNKVFLRNDNSWQTVTPANIGAVPTTRKVNNKALSSDVTLTPSDIGAANE